MDSSLHRLAQSLLRLRPSLVSLTELQTRAALLQDALNRLLAVVANSFSEFRTPTLQESQMMMDSYLWYVYSFVSPVSSF